MRFSLVFALLLAAAPLAAQTTLTDWNHQRLDHTRRAMWVLGGWAAANVAAGAVGLSRSQGEQRAFHQMNLGWGVINLGLAASGVWTASHTDPASLDWWSSQQELARLEKIFLFNAGLDVGYVAAGAWLHERGKHATKNADRLRGFGRSVMLQGAFLFVFDLGAYLYHRPLGERLRPLLPAESSIGLAPQGLGLSVRVGLGR